jgi:hypothetical protein
MIHNGGLGRTTGIGEQTGQATHNPFTGEGYNPSTAGDRTLRSARSLGRNAANVKGWPRQTPGIAVNRIEPEFEDPVRMRSFIFSVAK